MLAVNRQDEIVRLISERKFLSVDQLVQEFDVSDETIRRDLKSLEKRGVLKRTYGGAYLEGVRDNEVSVQVRKDKLVKNKEQIAELCCQFIKPGDTVFLDASTTSIEIAKRITHLPVSVITHSLIITHYLASFRSMRVITLGGTLDPINMCFSGKTTLAQLGHYYAKKGFVSCRSLSMKYGAMDSNEQIGQVRGLALQHSNECYLIADHTKFSNTALCKIGDIGDFDGLVTDTRPSDAWAEYLAEKQVPLYCPD